MTSVANVEAILDELRSLSTPQVAALLGVTQRQLNHWRNQGWIKGLPENAGIGGAIAVRWLPQHIDQARPLAVAARLRRRTLRSLAEEIGTLPKEAAS